ncbi:MAG: RelA/SpoT family protein [Acidimicrobiales bacterium]|tara:strand:+ start:7829 stop:10075 length:2247 start_codon:yes stop_codon:yes gene_type:complete
MVAARRVVPWRRRASGKSDETTALIDVYLERHPRGDVELIERAYKTAVLAHEGQTRKSGEPYVHHPLAVATIVAHQGLDDVTIGAALLHDSIEDTEIDLVDLERDFGPEVASIVDGVTKLDRINFDSREDQQAASMRKMLVAVAKDLRVLVIKLADRLHNMRTLAALPEFKQERTARETLDIYAPLANRLGMQDVKVQLEDLSLATLHPKRYSEIAQMVQDRAPERDMYLMQLVANVKERFSDMGIKADVSGRPKHLWSIYEKMIVKGRPFEEIYDLVGIRVIVENVGDCYAALGTIHATWKPVQGRFKDYIAMPKFNLYQSLHTTVIGPQAKQAEFQIRTREMHQRAEFGIASHWDYKIKSPSDEMEWLGRMVEWQEETADPNAFMANLKTDLEQDEVYIFTPKGDVVALPIGATPVDFAYSIHTEVGHRCVGAKVEGRLVPLNTRLASGQTVEIVASKQSEAAPSKDWLQFVASHRSASKIRQWYSQERRSEAIDTGHDDLVKELRRADLPVKETLDGETLATVANDLNYSDLDALFAAIGEHHVSAVSVIGKIEKALDELEPGRFKEQATVFHPQRERRDSSKVGVHVEGFSDLMIRLSRCCTPVPPDEVIGFVTKGRGVSVHRNDCANASSLSFDQPDRLIEVEWDDHLEGYFVASVEIKALDRPGLLRDVGDVMSENQVNVIGVETSTNISDRVARMRFDFEISDPTHLNRLMYAIREIDSVYDIYRVVPGGDEQEILSSSDN